MNHPCELYFYVVQRTDGKVIDTHNEAPYIVANDYESAIDLIDTLPKNVCYMLHSVEVSADLCLFDFVAETTD